MALAIPFGGGLKYLINEKVIFMFELGMRRTNSDYLDDVSTIYPDIESLSYINSLAGELSNRSNIQTGNNPVGQQRGNPDNLDWLFFGGVTVAVNIAH